MELKTVLASLGEMEFYDDLVPWWDEGIMTLPSHRPSFLNPPEVKICREWCGFEAALDPLLENVANRIAGDPYLLRLAWYFYWNIFECAGRFWKRSPSFQSSLGGDGGILYLLVALGLVPRLRNYHQTLGVPENVTRETCQQVRWVCGNYERVHQGRRGLFIRQLTWLQLYLRGNLFFRLGRFEYWLNFFPGGLHVFRNRQTDEVVVLADAGSVFTREGFAEPAGQENSPPECWKSSFVMDAAAVKGYPISPWGKAIRNEISLPLDLWQPALVKGDPVLSLHIPPGGKMGINECGESLNRAVEFFRRNFPEKPPVAITCSSWMFSPLLEQILPPASNLVLFERELYLYSCASTELSWLWFVFLQEKLDFKTAPRETSLQRAILGFLEAGHTWRNGNMFFLIDDLKHFGKQYYRSKWTLGTP
ncbi:MAG: acyltransferase domain-containing protein [Candidatus Omnitrophota bacterium]